MARTSKPSVPLSLIFTAGTPPRVACESSKEWVTTAFAATATSSPRVMSPKTLAPGPMYTLFPILGARSPYRLSVPMFVPAWILQFSPIRELLWTTIVPLWGMQRPGPNVFGGMVKFNF